jgi:hypothetical protein
MNPQMQMWLGPTRRIPVLTEGMRLTIAAIDLAGGRPLSEAAVQPGWGRRGLCGSDAGVAGPLK